MGPEGHHLHIKAVGDISFNGDYFALAAQGRSHEPLASVIEPLRSDLTIGNFEAPIAGTDDPSVPWRFCLRSDASYIPQLRSAGFHVLTLANNHMMDFGWRGAERTRAAIEDAGIRTVGLGKDLPAARKALRVEAAGKTISILAYCDVEVKMDLYATASTPGVCPADEAFLFSDVEAASRESDHVVVCMHWGNEFVPVPSPRQRRMAHRLAQSGASLIIGHHPHVLQPQQRIGSTVVAYSLGNFVFSPDLWHGKNESGESFAMPYALLPEYRKGGILEFHPHERDWQVESTQITPSGEIHTTSEPPRQDTWSALRWNMSRIVWSGSVAKRRAQTLAREWQLDKVSLRRLLKVRPKHVFSFVKAMCSRR